MISDGVFRYKFHAIAVYKDTLHLHHKHILDFFPKTFVSGSELLHLSENAVEWMSDQIICKG